MIRIELTEGELRAVLVVIDQLVVDPRSDLGRAEFKLDSALLEHEMHEEERS